MPQSNRPMSETDLAAIIEDQVRDSIIYNRDDLARRRTKAIQYYEGHETLGGDVPTRPNRSSLVSQDMSDTHGWIMPALLRVFLSSDRVVVYEPRRRGKEDAAKQATNYVNYCFFSECDGYQVLHSGFWDGLSFGNGILKHWWDSEPEYKVETLSGLTEARYIEIVSDPTTEEVLEHTARPDLSVDNEISPDRTATAAGTTIGAAPGDPAIDSSFDNGGSAEQSNDGFANRGAGSTGEIRDNAGLGGTGPIDGAPQLHDLKIKRRIRNGRLCLKAIPGEEFRLDRAATRLDEEHVRFAAHVSRRTRSALIKDGYKRDIVDDLPADSERIIETQESLARDDRITGGDNPPDRSTDLIEVWECYVQLDYDGDGVAEWRRVVTAARGSKRAILLNEEWGDDLPFTDLVPDPMPHRWRGRSLYEEVADLQRMKTVFLRGFADNLYWVNNPRTQGPRNGVDAASLDALVNPQFGDHIWTIGNAVITELPTPFIGDKLLMGLDLADKIREFRTGVSAATMSLDPEALSNQTATAVNAAQTASYSKVETYARNIADYGGLKRLFSCLLKLICKNQDEVRTIRLRGDWVDIDPRGWDADMDVIINVGLGSGSRDRDMAALNAIAQKQEMINQALGPMIAAQLGLGPDVVFNTYRKMVEAAGLKSPETFFPDITKQDVDALIQKMSQQQGQNPQMAESQARIQLIAAQTQKTQVEAAAAHMRAQTDMTTAQTGNAQSMLDLEHMKAQIENLRAAAMANMAKAGAVQSDAQINAQLAQLETLDRLVSLHHDQQKINQDQQRVTNERHRMLQQVATPGVDA